MTSTRREFTTGVTAAVGAGTLGVSARRVTGQESGERSQGRLSVMTFNIHHGAGSDGVYDLRRVAGIVWAADPDIVGIQEVDRGFGARSEFDDQSKRLAEWLDREYVFGANLNLEPTEASGGERRQYGTAILTKPEYPIVDSSNYPLPKIEYEDRYSEQRGLLETRLDVGGTPLYVYNTHLGLTEEQRRQQVERILELTSRRDGRALLLGDFNFTPDSEPYATLSTEFDDAGAAVGADGPTFPAPYETEDPPERRRIDYVFSRGTLPVQSGRVIETIASDHVPLRTTHVVPAPDAPFAVLVDCDVDDPARVRIRNVADRRLELRDDDSAGVDAVEGRPVLDPGSEYARAGVETGEAVLLAYGPDSGERVGPEVRATVDC